MIYVGEREGRIRGRRNKRKLARVARTRREILRYTFLFALLFVGVAGFIKVSWSVADPDTDILVSGNDVVSAKQVRRVLRGCLQRPIYSLNPKELEAKVQSLPDVQHAFIRRYLFPRPHLLVEVMEEFPWASFSLGPDQPISAVISQTGRLIPLSQFPTVPQPELVIYGNADAHFTDTDVSTWANLTNYVKAQTTQPVQYVDMRKSNDVQLKVADLRLKLGTADSMLSKRIGRLPSVLPVLANLKKENIEYVDLSLDSNVPLKVSKLPKKEDTKDANKPTLVGASSPHAVASQPVKPTL